MSASSVSHQLSVLRTAKLVKRIKSGNVITYSLDDYHVVKIMEYGLAHVCEKEDGKSSAVGCVRHINSGTDLRVKYISARRKK